MEVLIKSFQLLRTGGRIRQCMANISLKHHQSLSTSFPLLSFETKLQPKEAGTKFDLQGPSASDAISLVNRVIESKEEGRLFAVVQVCGKQFKVTNNDIIIVEAHWPPDIGDEIRLEKVLLLGSGSFSLVGRPILPLNQVSIKATIIEKSLAHTKVRFKYVRRKQYKRIHFVKTPQTFIRINSIELLGKVNELGDVDGTTDRIF